MNRGNYHGGHGTRLYRIWRSMRSRCNTPTAGGYEYYGGRGIRVCDEWEFFSDFRNWALASGYRDGLELDREDNDGDYEPSNCRWLSHFDNANNRRLKRIAFGEEKTLTDWCRDPRCVVASATVYFRLRKGWTLEEALETLPHGLCKQGHPMTEANRYANGGCRTCQIERQRTRRQAARSQGL